MFCSSLRRRKDWSAAVSSLLQAPAPAWQEQALNDYDIAIPIPKTGKVLKIILMTTLEAEKDAAKARLLCFIASDSTHNGIVMLAMTGPRSMKTFLDLQKELILSRGVSIMPIPSIQEACKRLNETRQQIARNAGINANIATYSTSIRDIVSRCVTGPSLLTSQVDILTGITPGLGSLASDILDADRQEAIFDHLGYEDGHRVLSFFISGPKPFRG